MRDDVTAVIPTIPPRMSTLLPHALKSVIVQTHPVAGISLAVDYERRGAWHTRQRALDAARTEWVAFLDDDDTWESFHLERLLMKARETEADYVFSWFWPGHMCGPDRIGHFGKEFDPSAPHHTTMNVMVKTELAQAVGFSPPGENARVGDEDWRFTLECVAKGAKIIHLPERTWHYNCLAGTHGLPDRW